MTSLDASVEALLILAVAACIGALGAVVQCDALHRCEAAMTCANSSTFSNGWQTCSFANYVDVIGDKLYGNKANDATGNYAALTRGVCAPGERVHRNSVSGRLECAPWRMWPSALNTEIMDPNATRMHTRMCGAWIEAGPTIETTLDYWSFHDGFRAEAAVRHADRAAYQSAHLSSTDMGKFYSSCTAAALSGNAAVRSAAMGAYTHLKHGLNNLTTQRRILKAAGWLASHHCDSPVQIGVAVSGAGFCATVQQGSSFSASALADALYALDEPRSLQEQARVGNGLVNANALQSPATTKEEIEYVWKGATGRTDHGAVDVLMASTPSLDGLTYISANAQARYAEASAYLHGVAALCSFAIRGGIDVESAGEYTAATGELQSLRAKRPPAKALGRLQGEHYGRSLSMVDDGILTQASTVTLSQIQAAPRGDAQADCAAMVDFLFPDRMDEQHFRLLVTDSLYERAREITAALRESAARVVTDNEVIRNVLGNPEAVAEDIRNTRTRIAGAPRGTWAGLQRDYPDGLLSSGDGPLIMALKQSRAVFTDRVGLLFDNENPCSGPPVYDALGANAYIYASALCTHMLLGMLRKPFADERYDNTSLATRFGYVMAHELAHTTLNTHFIEPEYSNLLQEYSTPTVYDEAIADVISALAIIHAGLATGEEVCRHVSQLWCARVPIGYDHDATGSIHPGPNDRGDHLCATLRDLGVY